MCPRRFRYPGRRRADDRAALEGILYAVRTGIGWNRLPTGVRSKGDHTDQARSAAASLVPSIT